MPVGDVSHLVTEWGYIILIMSDKKILCIGEKDMESKLDMLFNKNLYTVAINLVQSQQADPASTAEVLRKYGDHLYGKQEYDDAMSQYIHTIGHLEPSHVIQKFLEANQAGLTVKEYGIILVEHRPAETVEILLRLCTDGGDPMTRRGANSMHMLMIPSPMDFVNIFVHSPQYLMEFI